VQIAKQTVVQKLFSYMISSNWNQYVLFRWLFDIISVNAPFPGEMRRTVDQTIFVSTDEQTSGFL
jgi:hypothetical protein